MRARGRLEPVEQTSDLRIGDAVVYELVEKPELSTSRRGAAARHEGGFVPTQDGGRGLEVALLSQPRFEGREIG